MERRSLEKRRHVDNMQNKQAASLDATVSKSLVRHLDQAEAAKSEKLSMVAFENRKHEKKVDAIRKLIEEQRLASVQTLKAKEKQEEARERTLQAKQSEIQFLF